MRIRIGISIPFFLVMFSFLNFSQAFTQSFRPTLPIDSTLINDPQKVVVLKNSLGWAFDSTYTQALIDSWEIRLVQKILREKRKQIGSNQYKFDEYKIQLIVAFNSKKEKIVFVNGFCDTFGHNDIDWKQDFVTVYDGGECFFEAQINLTKRKIHFFRYHGYA